MTQRIVLDTDIGTDVDDALALVLAANSPEIELECVTTVSARTEVRARLARRLLELTGRADVPVVAGAPSALRGDTYDQFMPDGLWLGHEGSPLLSGEEIAEATDLPVDPGTAVSRIVEALSTGAADVVVTIGPVTNLAMVLLEHPEVAARIRRIVTMGGCVFGPARLGDHELSPIMEFNLNADREAARVVLTAGIPVTLVPLELTSQTQLSLHDVEVLRTGDKAGQALADLIDVWSPIFRRLFASFGVPDDTLDPLAAHLHDPLALIALIQPSLLSFVDTHIDLLTDEEGGLLTKPGDEGAIPVRVATAMDWPAVHELVTTRLRGGSP